MKRSLSNLSKYSIQTKDGTNGKIKDFLFDEESWVIRYIDADFGGLFKNRRILIPTALLGEPNWEEKHFHINLSEESIQACPDLDEKAPVSREYETELNKYYEIRNYWPHGYTITAAASMIFPPRPLQVPSKIVNEEDLDTEMRSYNELKGYHINAIDGKLGSVKDIVIDEDDWQIVYAIIDTSDWQPWSKKVLLPINWLNKISYTKKEVDIELHTGTIKNAPEFEDMVNLNLELENELYDFYKNTLTY